MPLVNTAGGASWGKSASWWWRGMGFGSIGHITIPAMDTVTHSHATTMMQTYPACSAAVFTSAFNKGQSATASLPSFIDRFPCLDSPLNQYPNDHADNNRRFDFSGFHQFIKCETGFFLFHLVPASKYAQGNPGKQFFPWRVSTIGAAIYFSGNNCEITASVAAISFGSPLNAAQRKGPLPSQNNGLIYAGTNRENQKHFSNLFPAPSPVYYFHSQM